MLTLADKGGGVVWQMLTLHKTFHGLFKSLTLIALVLSLERGAVVHGAVLTWSNCFDF